MDLLLYFLCCLLLLTMNLLVFLDFQNCLLLLASYPIVLACAILGAYQFHRLNVFHTAVTVLPFDQNAIILLVGFYLCLSGSSCIYWCYFTEPHQLLLTWLTDYFLVYTLLGFALAWYTVWYVTAATRFFTLPLPLRVRKSRAELVSLARHLEDDDGRKNTAWVWDKDGNKTVFEKLVAMNT